MTAKLAIATATAPESSGALTDFSDLRTYLRGAFPQRADVIDGSLAAVVAGEHVLLLGPPGTAKSALVRAIAQSLGGTYFERLLTRFSTPEELFGPVSLKALEADRFERQIAGTLVTADFAFIDEIFKANSAILNSMLAVINERVFHNPGKVLCPLVTCFGASNELPEGKDLGALFDRFLLRYQVDYLRRPSDFRAMLFGAAPNPPALSMESLKEARAESGRVRVSDATVDGLAQIRDALRADGIIASDRRWKKSLSLLKACAWLSGAVETCPEDLGILADGLWQDPKDAPKVRAVVGSIADPVSAKAREILDSAREAADKIRQVPTTDRKVYVAKAAEALQVFTAQKEALSKLCKGAGPRAAQTVADSTAEIDSMHADVARTVSASLGVRR